MIDATVNRNTSIEQICQAAYVGTKAFYELFDGREATGMLIATLVYAVADWLLDADPGRPHPRPNPDHRPHQLIHTALTTHQMADGSLWTLIRTVDNGSL